MKKEEICKLVKETHGDVPEVFWTLFSGHFPPQNWEVEINKIPERFRDLYFKNGVNLTLDQDRFTNPSGKISVIPDGYSPDSLPNLISDTSTSEAEFSTIALCLHNIADAFQKSVEKDPLFPVFVEAISEWEEEESSF